MVGGVSSPISPNQVVAHNLAGARRLHGWTQARAVEELEPHLGVRWSKASYSQAERSYHDPDRIRQFSADDLYAFCRAFELPVAYFFLPPAPERGERPRHIGGPRAKVEPEGPGRFLESVFSTGKWELGERMQQLFQALPTRSLTRGQRALEDAVNVDFLASFNAAFGRAGQWRATLLELADRLAEVEQGATRPWAEEPPPREEQS